MIINVHIPLKTVFALCTVCEPNAKKNKTNNANPNLAYPTRIIFQWLALGVALGQGSLRWVRKGVRYQHVGIGKAKVGFRVAVEYRLNPFNPACTLRFTLWVFQIPIKGVHMLQLYGIYVNYLLLR